jgi:hypothetical protein
MFFGACVVLGSLGDTNLRAGEQRDWWWNSGFWAGKSWGFIELVAKHICKNML